jgi:hypothetical protein
LEAERRGCAGLSAMPRRLRVLLLIGALAAAPSACGGSKPGFARYSAAQVIGTFRTMTGVQLVRDTTAAQSFGVLHAPMTDTNTALALDARYGNFTIYVLQSPSDRAIYTRSTSGGTVSPDARGVYWQPASGGGWVAEKPFANVVLSVIYSAHQLDSSFATDQLILEQLGKPEAQARRALPPTERPCATRGIALAHGGTGTCVENGRRITVAGSGAALRLPWGRISLSNIQIGGTVTNEFGQTFNARGQFLIARLSVVNTGPAPINGLYDAGLTVDGALYSQDYDLQGLTAPSAFPLGPGESTPAVVGFQLPAAVALSAERKGALVFPAGGLPSSLDMAPALGYLRLGGASASPLPAPPAPPSSPLPGSTV